jgi:hypothetical protein
MPLSRLELVSSHGDQTLGNIRFAVHGSANGDEAAAILSGGLRFTEGRPTVSTNIVHAQDWTVNAEKQAQSLGGGAMPGNPGSVIVCAVPANFHLGYGIFTTAYVDRTLKRVSGAPLRYAAGRKQLAFYMSEDAEAARVHIESEIANGFAVTQHPQFILEPKFLVGWFNGPALGQLVKQLDVSVRAFEAIDYNRTEEALREMFQVLEPANAVLVPTVMRDIIIGTIESVVISRLRMMRWQGLGLLGYSFVEGREEVQITPVRDMAEQRARMDDLGRRLASSSLFNAELAWLKVYAAHELDLMRVELDGAELEAAAD